LSGHHGQVQALAFTPDGKQLATASYDKTIKIWDTNTGLEITTLYGHTESVYDVAYNPQDEKLLATVGFDGRILLWEVGTGNNTPSELGRHEWQAIHLAFSPDGSRLATAGSNGDAFLWDVKNKIRKCEFSDPKHDGVWANRAHSGQITTISFSPTNDYIVTASEDETAKIWRAADCALVSVLAGHTNVLSDVQFNPADGQTVVTASFDKTAKVWEILSGKPLATLAGHSGPVSSVTFNQSGTRIATASLDRTTKVWGKNLSGSSAQDSFKEIFTITSDGPVNSVDFSPDTSRIAIGSSTGEIIIFPFNTDELIALAKKRVPRSLRQDECKAYLHLDTCPAD
jgi:hypothetical protein